MLVYGSRSSWIWWSFSCVSNCTLSRFLTTYSFSTRIDSSRAMPSSSSICFWSRAWHTFLYLSSLKRSLEVNSLAVYRPLSSMSWQPWMILSRHTTLRYFSHSNLANEYACSASFDVLFKCLWYCKRSAACALIRFCCSRMTCLSDQHRCIHLCKCYSSSSFRICQRSTSSLTWPVCFCKAEICAS